MRLFVFVSISCWLAFANTLQAQNFPVLKRITLFRELVHKTHKPEPDSLLFVATDTLKVSLVADLSDTLHVAAIHVAFGTGTDTTQLSFSKRFVFDQSGNLPDGTTYKRIRRRIYLKLGNYVALNNAHARVKLEYEDGSYSALMYYRIQY